MNKRGQVTIFIILAIIIVAAVVLILFFSGKSEVETPTEVNPKPFIQDCVKDSVKDSIYKIAYSGGVLSPSQSISYNDENYTYLCYQGDYLKGCINHYPLLEKLIEKEIEEDTSEDVEDCFDSLGDDLTNKGYDVSIGNVDYSVDLVPGSIKINLENDVVISKEKNSRSFKDFDGNLGSSLYEVIGVVREIINGKALYCDFDSNYFMLLYPKYNITRISYKESELYRINKRSDDLNFKFAVRSCVIPPGVLV